MNWKALLILVLLPSLVLAQQPAPRPTVNHPPVESVPPGDDNIAPLKKGQPAPFDGQLFDVDTAIRWGNWLQQYRYRLVWDVELEQKLCVEEKTYRDDLLKIEKERAGKTEEALQKALTTSEQKRLEAEEEVRDPPWYSTPGFGAAVGAAVAVGAMAVAIWALEARND